VKSLFFAGWQRNKLPLTWTVASARPAGRRSSGDLKLPGSAIVPRRRPQKRPHRQDRRGIDRRSAIAREAIPKATGMVRDKFHCFAHRITEPVETLL